MRLKYRSASHFPIYQSQASGLHLHSVYIHSFTPVLYGIYRTRAENAYYTTIIDYLLLLQQHSKTALGNPRHVASPPAAFVTFRYLPVRQKDVYT